MSLNLLRDLSGLEVLLSYLRLAMRLLLRPIPRHFSRCGAKRDAAMLRLQLGHTHSLFFHWLYTWPNTSSPGWSTISGEFNAINKELVFITQLHRTATELIIHKPTDGLQRAFIARLFCSPSCVINMDRTKEFTQCVSTRR